MKGERVLGAKFHVGTQAGGKVFSSVDVLRGGVEIEMWPMGLLVTGREGGKNFRFVATYNNVVAFELDPTGPATEQAPAAPAKAPKAK